MSAGEAQRGWGRIVLGSVTHSSSTAPGGKPVATAAIWGSDPAALHDLFWASQGVQVIRPGEPAPSGAGPRLYLLLQPGEMCLFPLGEVVERMNWLKPRVVRLRIVEPRPETYREFVERGADGAFIGIRRSYRSEARSSMRVGLTTDGAFAARWQAEPERRSRRRMLASSSSSERGASLQTTGRVLQAGAEDAARLVAELQRTWRQPDVVFGRIYEFAPGVWAHETARVEEGARLIGPLWIGAGAVVRSRAAVVGPGVVEDAARIPAPRVADIRWADVYLPRWPKTWQAGIGQRRVVKRLFDIGFSLAALAATLPLYPVVIGAILIEDGWPPFFAHRRQTLRGREFGCIKFRTMQKNADAMKSSLVAANVADGPQFFIPDDPRLLRVGRVLRRLQIDELPQFINVLLGHMSVVGPRPSPDKENQYCPAWREARLSVRPGITGLWQVRRTREPETDFQEWIRYDLEYVQRSSLRLDIWIIMQTILRIMGR